MRRDNLRFDLLDFSELDARGLAWSDALFVHLYLADMAHFGAVNEAYCQHLSACEPPARACVQLQLPPGVPVLVEVLLTSEAQARGRRVLHVQSISSWAPSCIGPYSQACLQCCTNEISIADDILLRILTDWRLALRGLCCMPERFWTPRQGVQWGGLVWMAGQIGLDPPTMQLVAGKRSLSLPLSVNRNG